MANSFSRQLEELLNPLPKFADPEDDHDEATKARLSEAFADDDVEEEVGVGILRKKNAVPLADSDGRYLGKAVSRQQIFPHDEDDQQDDDDYYDDDDDINEKDEDGVREHEEEEDGSDEELEDEEEEEDDDGEEAKAEASEQESDDLGAGEMDLEDGDVRAFSRAKAGEEAEKGQAVRRQLALWDRLLRTRIQMQKALAGANRLPRPHVLPRFRARGGAPLAAALRDARRASEALRSSLADLHLRLLRQSAVTSVPETPNEGNAEDYSETAARRFAAFRPHGNTVLREWQDKTRLSSAKGGRFAALERDAPAQVEQILGDRERLLRRTRARRSDYRVLGDPPLRLPSPEEDGGAQRGAAAEEDEDAFDDDDFYHQLLRELIERKTAGEGGRQWLRIQKLRGKMKKKRVDTKASKGRKVRFHAHAKLLNFMAPVVRADDLARDARDQLFRGLFAVPDTRYVAG
ncbi:protein AATF-like [Corythoichthys intestinalis]|uniref:protein AATF-like n=1 Tax=Corythoichthys intestinalis TaxID=161448 RepID=UPI0025A5647E|nr:protein AATF-like [Corythoichthys intestinalis]